MFAAGVSPLGHARANGRFPAAVQIAFAPNDANHFALSATFGLLESRDGGKSFTWACEPVLGLSGTIDPAVAITSGGVTVLSGNQGVMTTSDDCTFTSGAGLTSQTPPDLTLNRASPNELFAFTASVLPGERFDSHVLHSTDEGRSWTPTGPALPDDVLPNTIDVAPSDGTRVYVSGRLGSADNYVSLLLRSNDAGQSFERTPAIPGTENLKYAYIAAVHPKNPDLVYVRVANLSGTVVLVSDDAGTSFTELFQTTGSALGFAVSDDELALGGPSDGIWTGDIMGAALERRSDVGPSCLAYGPAGLYACADAARDGFSLGVLRPNATSFEPLLDFATLCGPASCGSDTAVGTRCPYEWDNYLAERLGATCGGGSAGSDGAGGQGGADGGSATGGDAAGGDAAGGSTSGGSRSAGSGGSGRAAGPASSDEDGSCALVSSKARRPMLGIGALAFAMLAAVRRAVRRRRAPVRA